MSLNHFGKRIQFTLFQAISGFDTGAANPFILYMVDVKLFPKLQYVFGFHATKIMKKD